MFSKNAVIAEGFARFDDHSRRLGAGADSPVFTCSRSSSRLTRCLILTSRAYLPNDKQLELCGRKQYIQQESYIINVTSE